MPIRKSTLAQLPARVGQSIVLLDDPPMGHLQAIVLKSIAELEGSNDASGYDVLEALSITCGAWIDHSQIYASIRKLLSTSKKRPQPYIESSGERRSQDGGPPYKLYRLTAAGRSALEATHAHYVAVETFLRGPRKRR